MKIEGNSLSIVGRMTATSTTRDERPNDLAVRRDIGEKTRRLVDPYFQGKEMRKKFAEGLLPAFAPRSQAAQ